MCSTLDDLKKMLHVCEDYAKVHNLEFSTHPNPIKSKTKYIGFLLKKIDLPQLYLCKNPLRWRDSGKDLGTEIEKYPKIGLERSTLDAVNEISLTKENAHQAKSILKHSLMSSLKKVKLLEQLWFIKSCIGENLVTSRIVGSSKRLGLNVRQQKKLQKTMMINIKNDLHKELSVRKKELDKNWKDLKIVFTKNEILLMSRILAEEQNNIKQRCRKHFKNKIEWMRKQQEKRENMKIPNEVDGIVIERQDLPENFTTEARVYGDVVLDDNEKEIIDLPPKFAVYEKLDGIVFKANLQKTFNKIRWNEQYKGEKGDDIPEVDEFHCGKTKTFDGKKLGSSSLPFKKRVAIPEYADEATEAQLILCKTEIEKVFKEYTEKNNPEGSNLTEEQKIGFKSLKERIKKKEVVCFPTDKSGRMSIDTPENYINSMTPHLEGTVEATAKEYETSKRLLNAHMKSWSRISNFDLRVTSNFQSSNNEIPPQYGMRKDHKCIPIGDENKGPPQRPVCGAVVSSNYRMSYFISSIIQPIINNAAEPCTSTEDLLRRIEHLNKNDNLENCIIESMDVTALYPSIDKEFSVDRCVEMILESGVRFKHVNVEELGLSLCVDEETLFEHQPRRFCPIRKNKGRRPTITGSGTEGNERKRWQYWKKIEAKPSPTEERRMICYALGVAMKTTLKNHIFQFNDQIRKQENGGAIGVKLQEILLDYS